MMVMMMMALQVSAQKVRAQKVSWTGAYMAEHCAGKTAGGTSICYNTELVLEKGSDGRYHGTMSIDGWQTMVRATVYAIDNGKSLAVFYQSPQEDNMGFTVEEGTLLLRMQKKQKRIVTIWGEDMKEAEFVTAMTRMQK